VKVYITGHLSPRDSTNSASVAQQLVAAVRSRSVREDLADSSD